MPAPVPSPGEMRRSKKQLLPSRSPFSAGGSLITIQCIKAEQRPFLPMEEGIYSLEQGLWSPTAWIQILQGQPPGYVTLGKLAEIIEHRWSHLQNGDGNNTISWGGYWSKRVFLKCLARHRHFGAELNIILRESIFITG